MASAGTPAAPWYLRHIDRAVRKFPAGLGLDSGYSVPSMRATSYGD
jgi:hypothetical protein